MDRFEVNHEEATEILDWAISAAALLHLMITAPRTDDPNEKLEADEQAITNILENMPPVMVAPVLEWAEECYDSAIETEDTVQQFVAELEEVKPEDFNDGD